MALPILVKGEGTANIQLKTGGGGGVKASSISNILAYNSIFLNKFHKPAPNGGELRKVSITLCTLKIIKIIQHKLLLSKL